MVLTRTRKGMLPAAAASSSDDDDGEVETRPTKRRRPPPAPTDESESESDPEPDGAPLKPTSPSKENVPAAADPDPAPAPSNEAERRPTKRPPALVDGDDDDEDGDSDGAPLKPTPPSKEGVPSADLAKLPQRKTKAANPAEAADHGQAPGGSTGKQFEEKIATYMFLGPEVMALEAERPGMFKRAFLKLPDAKARALDNKIKKRTLAALRVALRRGDLEKEVTKAIIDLLK